MSNFIVVVFPNETKAYQGLRVLKELNSQGAISLYGHAVVYRDEQGVVSVKQKTEEGPLALAVGALVGGLLGLLGGPAGAALGFAGGGLIGGIHNLFNLGLSEEFLETVERDLAPTQYAVIAEVSEEWITPLDPRMEELGGTVIREMREELAEETIKARITRSKAELARLRAVRTGTEAEIKQAWLAAQIKREIAKLERSAQKARQQLERTEQETNAKLEALQVQADKADPQLKRQIEQRIARTRAEYYRRSGKLKEAWGLTQEALRS
jgi:uncharacterized membrane protein